MIFNIYINFYRRINTSAQAGNSKLKYIILLLQNLWIIKTLTFVVFSLIFTSIIYLYSFCFYELKSILYEYSDYGDHINSSIYI